MATPTTSDVVVYLPDDRRVRLGRYTAANWKVGPGVYSYSRFPGLLDNVHESANATHLWTGTCPGSTPVCRSMCYAMRIAENPLLAKVYEMNDGADVPPLPEDATLIRWHISGDFDSAEYVENWISVCLDNPGVTFWGYTRSWRITSAMLPALKRLRDLPNVQLFASVDPGTAQGVIDTLYRDGWRVARIATEGAAVRLRGQDIVCAEETGEALDCVQCGFCFRAQTGDVVFIEHNGE